MIITRVSALTGKRRSIDLPVTQEQLDKYYNSKEVNLIQNVFPHLTADQREFIKTGVTQDEWNEAFPPEPEDEMPLNL